MNLIFLDSEGTIRHKGKVIPNINEIFVHYEENNVIPILATGLPKHLILEQYKGIYDFKYLVSSNGSLITNNLNEVLFYAPIESDILPFLVSQRMKYRFHLKATVYGEEYTTNLNYVDAHTSYLSFEEMAKLSNYCQVYLKVDLNLSIEEKQKEIAEFDYSKLSSKDIKKYQKLLATATIDDIYKFIAYANLCPLREEIKAFEGISIGNDSENFYNFDLKHEDTWLSINANGISKYSAVCFLTQYLNVDLTDTIFMGNDLNDHEALLSCPFSICISSKKKKIKISNGINIKESNVEFLLYYLLAYLKAGFSVNDYKCDIVKENLNVPLIVRLSDSKTDILNIRFAARGVVYTSSGDVVLFYKERIGEIKLPGGGLENNEKPLEGFIREVSEEIGYDVCDVKLVGYSIERKERNNFKQFSFVFTAKTKNPNNPHPTLEEQLDYSKGINCTIEEALSKFDNALKQLKNLDDIDLYHEKFIVKRDKKIFNYIIKGN